MLGFRKPKRTVSATRRNEFFTRRSPQQFMVQPTTTRRIALAALALVLCVGGWWRADASQATPVARWTQAVSLAAAPAVTRTVLTDFDGDGDTDRVALHADLVVQVSRNDGLERSAPLAAVEAARWAAHALHVTSVDDSTTDNSDESDPMAHVEPRAGPLASRHSRAVPPLRSTTPRSRTHSSSTPRAPPASRRLA